MRIKMEGGAYFTRYACRNFQERVSTMIATLILFKLRGHINIHKNPKGQLVSTYFFSWSHHNSRWSP